jgi:hypothetical protein
MTFIKSKWFIFTMILTLALPVLAFAEGGEDTKENIPQKKWEQKIKHRKHHMQFGAHKDMYFMLLAEKYTPSQLNEWKVALDERKALKAQLKELNAKEHLKDKLKAKKEQAKQNHREELKKLKEKVQNGELTEEEAKELMKERLKDKFNSKVKNSNYVEIKKAFHEAIVAKDEESIATTLPKMLELINMENNRLKQLIETLSAQ